MGPQFAAMEIMLNIMERTRMETGMVSVRWRLKPRIRLSILVIVSQFIQVNGPMI